MPKENYRKLRDFADEHNLTYNTVYKQWKKGLIYGKQHPVTGTIFVTCYKSEMPEGSSDVEKTGTAAILYARVSPTANKQHDIAEARHELEKLKEYAEANDYAVVDSLADIGMGIAPNRPDLIRLLARDDWDVLIVRNRQTPMLVGTVYLEAALEGLGRKIEYLEQSDTLDVGSEDKVLKLAKDVNHLLNIAYGPGLSKKVIRHGLQHITS